MKTNETKDQHAIRLIKLCGEREDMAIDTLNWAMFHVNHNRALNLIQFRINLFKAELQCK